MKLKGNKLYPKQSEIAKSIISSSKMYEVVDAGRQTGKSYLAKQLLLYYGFNWPKSQIMFISMTYSQTTKIYKEMMQLIKPFGIIKSFNRKENSIILKNDSEIYFKSYQQCDNIRGYSNDVLIIDEAAYCDDEDFYSCLKPTLNVKGKKCILFSTPRGFNFFYDMYMYGENGDPRYNSYKMDYTTCPYSNIEEILDAQSKLPKKIFEAEYLGLFSENGMSAFENYMSCVNKQGLPKGEVIGGIDVGRQGDYTVLTIMNGRNVVYQERWRDDTWANIISNIVSALKIHRPNAVFVEVNGIGDVFFESLEAAYKEHNISGSLNPWVTSNSSKANIVERLNSDFNAMNINIPNKKELINELGVFEANYSKSSRAIVYGARGNLHDDLVMSLAICNYNSHKKQNSGKYIFE